MLCPLGLCLETKSPSTLGHGQYYIWLLIVNLSLVSQSIHLSTNLNEKKEQLGKLFPWILRLGFRPGPKASWLGMLAITPQRRLQHNMVQKKSTCSDFFCPCTASFCCNTAAATTTIITTSFGIDCFYNHHFYYYYFCISILANTTDYHY